MNIKEKVPVFIISIIVLIAFGLLYYFCLYHNDNYYTKIDNKYVKELKTNDNMKYEYTLTTYDDYGKKKTLSFKTSRVLKEDAYLNLKTMVTRGVVSWQEVSFEDLPEKVQDEYKK